MLENFETGNQVNFLLMIFESSGKQILSVLIVPAEIKTGIPHQPDKKPVSGAPVQGSVIFAEQEIYDRGDSCRQRCIAADNPCVIQS